MKYKILSLTVLLLFLASSCKKIANDKFPGKAGGQIITDKFIIEIPEGAVPKGAFTVGAVGSPVCDGVASKHFLHSNIIYFNGTVSHTEKPLKIILSYEMCDPEILYSERCTLSDLQAKPFQLSILNKSYIPSVNDSSNYTELNILSLDSVAKTITFEITDLTKMYLIARGYE